ncbi:Kinesin-5 [Acorus calamus]|uniref:Kinesin-5 n=1 Tax=Acorus calamus TaxID=4465 RepID=A0AAV9ERR4_ACOCL|nr:Kinesin-5 [Acorus calamus]
MMESDDKDVENDESLSRIKAEIATLNAKLNHFDLQRRQALNDLLDLKGNIRVFCRIRPILNNEYGHFGSVVSSDSTHVLLKFTESRRKYYALDRVFTPATSQDEVFSEIEPLIQSSLDGYNACIFAYGQTGTGKTFTMEGTSEWPGIVPRTLEELFKKSQTSHNKFLLEFSMLEIYMGILSDLLGPRNRKTTVRKIQSLSIRTGPDGGIEIDNLRAIRVVSADQPLLPMQIRSQADPTGGSERLLKTQASGRRLEEGKAINLSLSSLGDVISALQSKKPHIPYRNSKLTQVLKDSLGADSKTLMVVHVSPKDEDLCETVCTLGFATRARSIHLAQEESMELRLKKEYAIAELLKIVKKLEDECQEIRSDIENLYENLKYLTNVDSKSFDIPEDPQYDAGDKKPHVKNVKATPVLNQPRFMSSTACSRQKTSSLSPSAIRKKVQDPPVKRKSSSVYADSLSSPVKGISQSGYGSECSMSKTSCSNWIYNEECQSEFSEDSSECDVKMVVFAEQKKLPSTPYLSDKGFNRFKDGRTKKTERKKGLNFNNCPCPRKKEQTAAQIQRTKKGVTNAVPERMNVNKKGHIEMSAPIKLHTFDSFNFNAVDENDLNNDFALNRVDPLSEQEINQISIEMGSLLVDETQSSGNIFLIEDSSGDRTPQSDLGNTELHQSKQYEQTFHDSKHESESHKLDDKSNEAEDSIFKFTVLEEAGGAEILTSNGEVTDYFNGNLCSSPCPMQDVKKICLLPVKCQRDVVTPKGNMILDQKHEAREDSSTDLTNFQMDEHTGICNYFRKTVWMLCASVLLGLGIDNLGFGHEFFNGLML